MKRVKIISLFVLAISIFGACKKDHADKPGSSSEFSGTYEGKYGTGDNTPSVFFSFKISPNGVIEELAQTGAVRGSGIWTNSGNTILGSYKYPSPSTSKFSIKAVYDAATKKLTGTWGYGYNDSNGGKWYMIRK